MSEDTAEDLPDDGEGFVEFDETARIALEHAVRRWEAEEENARRLGGRANGLLALITGLFGLGLVKLGSLSEISPSWVFNTVRIGLAVGVVLAGFALFQILAVQRRKGPGRSLASVQLRWPDDCEPPFTELWPEEALEIAYSRTTKAALELQGSNVRKQGSVDDGQVILLLAGAAAGIGIICYLLFGEPSQTTTPPGRTPCLNLGTGSVPLPASTPPK